MFTRSGRGDELERLQAEISALRARAAEADVLREALAVERARGGAQPAPVAPSTGDESSAPGPLQTLSVEEFRDRAHRELERARRSGAPLSLALVDLDGFRELNASRGSEAGDAALTIVQDGLAALLRAADVLGRTGADEFAVLLVDTDLADAQRAGERLVAGLETADHAPSGAFTVSVGVAAYRRGESIERLLADAAEGLDRARAAGGGRVCARDEEHESEAAARRDVQLDVAEALAAALHERDAYTGEHSRSVVEMSRSVARVLGLGPAEIDRIAAAALLHDVGKVALPDTILHKADKLDDEEWRRVRELPIIAERILRAIPGLGDVARIVRHEHERWDGTGYPDGLAGEAIPIGSRIILACDTYHAMTSEGSYRPHLTHADAVRELTACAGTQFDPRVTEALIGDLHQGQQLGQLRIDGTTGTLRDVA